MPYFCYILECADGTFYTGWSTDPLRRLRQHNRGTGARYTRTRRPLRLVYVEPQPDRITAMRRERTLKNRTHIQKSHLIQQYRNEQETSSADIPSAGGV